MAINRWPKDIVEELKAALEFASLWEDDAGADLEELKILNKHALVDLESLRQRIRMKKQGCVSRLEDLNEIERSLRETP